MRCPICHRNFEPDSSNALPFCSERCRTIDAGRWLGEAYRLPVEPDSEFEESSEEDQPPDGDGAANGPVR